MRRREQIAARLLAVGLTAAIALGLLAGCGKEDPPQQSSGYYGGSDFKKPDPGVGGAPKAGKPGAAERP